MVMIKLLNGKINSDASRSQIVKRLNNLLDHTMIIICGFD